MTKPAWTVLLVDDAPEDRDVYRRYLQRDPTADYRFWEAELGTYALALCQTRQPDCIVLDYRLPDLDSVECLSRLQAQAGVLAAPVILLTGVGNEAVAVEAMKQGAHDYLVKGHLTSEALCRAVHHAIEKATLLRSLEAHRQQIQEREAQLRLALEAAQMESWSWDVLTDSLTYMGSGETFSGETGTLAPATAADLFALVHPEDRDALRHEPLYTTKPAGTGLGLYIVQEIVAAHEGQVTVQSTKGCGTTFTITLPRTPSAPLAQPAGAP